MLFFLPYGTSEDTFLLGATVLKLLSIWHGAVYAEYQKRYQELARLGHEVTLVIPKQWGAGLVRGTRAERLPEARFRIVALPVQWAWHGALFRYRGLARALDEAAPELIECIEEPFSLAARQVVRWRRRRAPDTPLVISTCQNLFKRYPWPFRAWERAALEAADALTGLNAESLEVFRRKGYAGPTAVIPTGIDPAIFKPHEGTGRRFREQYKIPLDAPLVGYAGRLAAEKGIETLLQAAAGLPQAVQLALAGGGPDKARLREVAQKIGIADRLHWLPPLEQAAMPAFFNAAQIVVLPSLTRPNWKEQFGRVLVEAMACGANVVGSDSGEIPQVVGEAGLIFEEGRADALAAQLRRLLDDRELAARLREAGVRRVAERYTWEVVARRLHDFFQQIINRPRNA